MSLQQSWKDASFLRCSGGRRRDQKFISVIINHIRRKLYAGGFRKSVLISFLPEEESKKLRTITVRRKMEVSENGIVGNEIME